TVREPDASLTKLELVKLCYKFCAHFRREQANKLQESRVFRVIEYVGHVRDDSFALIEGRDKNKDRTRLVEVSWIRATKFCPIRVEKCCGILDKP
ncbi:unnamed protein product, partial [Heterotrigona itama]